jgi:fructose-1,6-bisphosphatase/inositol monophosphatase family enzyme
VVREAGGFVSEIDGDDFMKTGAVIAANGSLMPQLTKAVRAG